jgi:hypothetical protein
LLLRMLLPQPAGAFLSKPLSKKQSKNCPLAGPKTSERVFIFAGNWCVQLRRHSKVKTPAKTGAQLRPIGMIGSVFETRSAA